MRLYLTGAAALCYHGKKEALCPWNTAAGKEGDTMHTIHGSLPLWTGLWQLLSLAVLIGVLVLIVLL